MAPENKTAIKPPPAHPLQSFGLANFKAFGAIEQQVPLRPITLVFGPNSSGKSSIIHYLLWMKDVVEGKGLDIYTPSAGGDSVDLGGFKQIRHGTVSETEICTRHSLTIKDSHQREHKLETASVFSSCQPPTDFAGRLKSLIAQRWEDIRSRNTVESLLANTEALEAKVVDVSLKDLLGKDFGDDKLERALTENDGGNDNYGEPFGMPRSEMVNLHCPKIAQVRRDWWESLGESSVLREPTIDRPTYDELLFEYQQLAEAILNKLNYRPPSKAEIRPALVRFELREAGEIRLRVIRNEARQLAIERLDTSWLIAFRNEFLTGPTNADFEAAGSAVLGRVVFDGIDGLIPMKFRVDDSEMPASDSAVLHVIKGVMEGTEEVPGLLRLCAEDAKKQFQKISYLGPLRTYPDRDLTVTDLPKAHDPEGLFSWRQLYEDESIRQEVNKWLSDHSCYEIMTDDRVSLAKVRDVLTPDLELGISTWVENVKAARKRMDVDQTSKNSDWMTAPEDWDYPTMIREVIDSLQSKITSDSTGTLFLRDLHSGKQVTSRDIGVGISQLIPVLVQAKAAKGEFIAIEQPEIHIHPALQAELGDVFIESALKQGNTFLIETHSEHLILRLLRRIRETTAGELEGRPPLRPENLCVLYVEPGEGGAKVTEIPVNDDGDFDRPWPNGFFGERSNELF